MQPRAVERVLGLYTRYPIVARALGLAAALAFRPSASREQRYLAYKSWGPGKNSSGAFFELCFFVEKIKMQPIMSQFSLLSF